MFRRDWPKFDPELAAEDEIEFPIQVNGKLRGHLRVTPGKSDAELEQLARQNERIKPFLEGKQVVKVIIIPGRLINVVVK